MIDFNSNRISVEGSKTETTSSTTQIGEFYDSDTLHLISLISGMLNRLILHNDRIPHSLNRLTRFHSKARPSLRIEDYLVRLVKYGQISKTSLICILIYTDRVCSMNPNFIISSLTIHRFLLVALTISTKALSDSFLTNQFYAKVGGISPAELSLLEFDFLALIKWNLLVNVGILQEYFVSLNQMEQNKVFIGSSSACVSAPIVPASDVPAFPSPYAATCDSSSTIIMATERPFSTTSDLHCFYQQRTPIIPRYSSPSICMS